MVITGRIWQLFSILLHMVFVTIYGSMGRRQLWYHYINNDTINGPFLFDCLFIK